jgi:uncharacterized membrane protein YfcA
MLALVFLSVGGFLPFVRSGAIERRTLPISIVLTVIGSGIGASLLLRIPSGPLQITIAVTMIAIAGFSLVKPDDRMAQHPVSLVSRTMGYAATFLLGIYGGVFSGGYVTMLTAVFVFFFGLTFLQSVATTKVINVFSSLVATAIFAWRGVLDYKLGIVLGATMFVGALIGGRIALRLPSVWLRRVFVIAVVALAGKMLVGFLL